MKRSRQKYTLHVYRVYKIHIVVKRLIPEILLTGEILPVYNRLTVSRGGFGAGKIFRPDICTTLTVFLVVS